MVADSRRRRQRPRVVSVSFLLLNELFSRQVPIEDLQTLAGQADFETTQPP